MSFETIEELKSFILTESNLSAFESGQLAERIFEAEGKIDPTQKINENFAKALDLLNEAKELSKMTPSSYFGWDLAYGLGGYLENGVWHSSSADC